MKSWKLDKTLFVVVIALISFSCTTVPPPKTTPSAQTEYLKTLCSRHKLYCGWDSLTQIISISSDNDEALALIGSDIVFIGDKRITLSAPVKMIESKVIVPMDFKYKVIDRVAITPKDIVQKKTKRVTDRSVRSPRRFYTTRRVREVVIDAGHGGKDPGAIGRTGLYEKDIVLDIALRLKRILEKNDIKVRLTRSNDEFISLKGRTEIASRTKADLFISIHANSNLSRGVNGIEVYCSKDLGRLEKNEAQRKINHKSIFKVFSMKKDPSLEKIISDMMYHNKQAESDALASSIVQTTSKITKARKLGVKHSRFFVLRNTLIPAVLVEVGFVSNPKEERLLKTLSYRQKIALGLARGILEYSKGKSQSTKRLTKIR